MREIFLLLGSNRGDRLLLLEKARRMIRENAGTLLQSSSLYESEPWGFRDETWFINQALEITTELNARELMDRLLEIEARLGRIRMLDGCGCNVPDPLTSGVLRMAGNQTSATGYSARIIDIDILFYGDKTIFTDQLMIPHPRLHVRRFTLEPMNEIVPRFIHPVLKKSIHELLETCTDQSKVVRIPANNPETFIPNP